MTNYQADKSRFFSENPAASDTEGGYGLVFKPILEEMEQHYAMDYRMLNALNSAVNRFLTGAQRAIAEKAKLGSSNQGGSGGNGTANPTQNNRNKLSQEDIRAIEARADESSTSRPGISTLGNVSAKPKNAYDIVKLMQGRSRVPNE